MIIHVLDKNRVRPWYKSTVWTFFSTSTQRKKPRKYLTLYSTSSTFCEGLENKLPVSHDRLSLYSLQKSKFGYSSPQNEKEIWNGPEWLWLAPSAGLRARSHYLRLKVQDQLHVYFQGCDCNNVMAFHLNTKNIVHLHLIDLTIKSNLCLLFIFKH